MHALLSLFICDSSDINGNVLTLTFITWFCFDFTLYAFEYIYICFLFLVKRDFKHNMKENERDFPIK